MSSNEKFEREFEAFLNEEDSRLASLYRKLPQQDPDARLDAAVRAMAHRALNPQLVATPRAEAHRRRAGGWLPVFGTAAGVVLAAGIAFKLGPGARSDRNESGAPARDIITVRQVDAPPPAAPPLSPPPPVASSGGNASSRAPAKPVAEEAAELPVPAAEQATKVSAAPGAEPERQALAGLKKAGNIEASAQQAQPSPAATRHRTIDAQKRLQEIAAGRWEDPYERKLDEATRAAARRSNPQPEPAAAVAQASTTAAPAESRQSAPAAFAAAPPSAAPAPATARAKSAVVSPPDNRPADTAASTDVRTTGSVLSDDTGSTQPRPRDADASAATVPAAPRAVQSDKAEKDAFPAPAPPLAATNTAPAGGLQREAPAALGQAKQRPRSNDPNAKLYPEHWLANIRKMLRDQRRDQALRSLGEFRKMYPDYHLPDDLRDLK